jgi:hypothetical protein
MLISLSLFRYRSLLGICFSYVQVLSPHPSASPLQVYTQHWHVVFPAVSHLHFQSHPPMFTSRISFLGSALPTPPFSSLVLLPGSILTHMSCPIHSTFCHFLTLMLFFHYPLGMGVLIVFHHVANQPHTPSPHFARFPTRTPRLSLYSSFFTCTSVVL